MSLQKSELIKLAKVVANANPASTTNYSFGTESFSYADLNETLRSELKELASNYKLYRENKNTIFELIEETVDAILPKKVLDQYGMFAEVKTFGQGDKPIFKQRISATSRLRAKKFVTKVGLAGVYEVFKLDKQEYEVPMTAIGGAAQIGFEEFLDGRVDFADLLDVIMEGMDEAIYREIAKALVGSITKLPLPTANYHTDTAFDEVEMDKLVAVADAYGQANIYCTYEFAATMLPATAWASDAIKAERWNNGYIANYKGHRVVVLPQSFEDETNAVKVIDPAYAWIIPADRNEKPVKVAFEGDTLVDERHNQDWSREVQVYKKLGVGVIMANDICVYHNSTLTK